METSIDIFDILIKYLPLLIPLFAVQIILAVVALVHVLRHPRYRFGNKIMWILIVLLVNMIGPILYFVFGRGEEE
jgi:hypothetical protein